MTGRGGGGNQNRLEENEYCVCIILNLKNPIKFKMYLTLAEGDMLSAPLKCSHDPVRAAIEKELSRSDRYHFQVKALDLMNGPSVVAFKPGTPEAKVG